MSSRIGMAALALLLVAAARVYPAASPAASAAAPGQATGAATLLYRWVFPARGSSGAWTFAQSTASYGGASNATLLAPYTLKHVANFAVQAQIQGTGPGGPDANLIGFGLVTRQVAANPHTTVAGGSYFSTNSEDDNPELSWNGDTVGGASFSPGTSWHLYRLEVRGSDYQLFIDGKQVAAYTIGDYPYPAHVGIFSTYYRVRVRNFAVYRLDAPSSPAPTFPPTKPYNLTVGDLPTTTFYLPTVQHYYTDEETARERGVTLASLQATGRVASYGTDFFAHGKDLIDVYSSVTAFTSAAAARADVPERLDALRPFYRAYPNYHELPGNLLAEVSAGFSTDFQAGGQKFSVLALFFARDGYEVLIRVTIFQGSLSADRLQRLAVTLGGIVDHRIQAGAPKGG